MGRGSFENRITIASCDCDPLSELTPPAALRLMQDVATAGIESVGFGHDALAERYGLVFVVAAHAVRFYQPVRCGDTVTVHTDPAGMRGAHLFRQTLLTAPDGALLAEGQTDWSLIDPATGKPQRATAFPGTLDALESWTPFCDPSRLKIPRADIPCGSHCVSGADTDQNRHMNNAVYARLMTDCFADLPPVPIGEFSLRYHRQAHVGEVISLLRGVSPQGERLACGAVGGEVCFLAAFSPRTP